MSFHFSKDDSILHLTKEELKIKNPKRRPSNFSIQNQSKPNLIMQNSVKLNKSISKLTQKKKRKSFSNKGEANIVKEYLHSHKFGIQRNKTRKITVKVPRSNINKSILINKVSLKDYATMVNYPNERKTKTKKEQIINLNKEKEKKPNLKQIENSLIIKINNMKNNVLNESMKENDNFVKLNTCQLIDSMNSHRSFNSNKNIINMNKSYSSNKNLNNRKFNINNNIFNNTSNNFHRQNSYNNSNINSNHKSSSFAPCRTNTAKLINNNAKTKSEIVHPPYEKSHIEIDKKGLKLTDYENNFPKLKFNIKKISNKSLISNNVINEKSRLLGKVKPLYDSFDDDESEKDEEYNENVLLPTSPIIFFLDLFLFLSSIYSLFYIPLRMAKPDCFCSEERTTNKIILYFIDILFIYDFCLTFFRAYYNYQLKLIKNNTKIFIHYLKSDCLFDFLEAIPIFSISNFLCSNNKQINYCFRYNMSTSLIIFKILTNLKIFKIFKVRNKQKNITFNFFLNLFSENYSLEKFLDNLFDFIFFLLAFHFFVCLNIFLAKQTYPNWIIANNTQDKTFLYNYITSSYSLIETLTTVGYGDVVCQCNIERIFQIFFLGVGVIAYSYIVSSFGNLIKNESQSSIKYNNNMRILEEIRVDYPNMPFKLYNKIYNYIECRNLAEKKFDSNLLTNSLPFNLRNALLLVMYDSYIKNFKLFKNCDNSNFIIQVLSKFVPSTSKKSEILVYEGEMIEEIVIVKDGRLSLEAAIDMENPEESIRNYFNINFQGITTAKEIKKLEEAKKLNNSQFIYSNKIKDFDNAKIFLNSIVKKQANYLLNSACEDNSILDKTKNDGKKENENETTINHLGSDFLKNEQIKNEEGNFKYIKIIDIRKNENFGGLYMFMRRPSPLSLKVKSKFAELYLLPKKDVFSIAKNNYNIWSKINKKDFHNMLSIKHQTFKILNKYIEINGIGKIAPTDLSRFIYAWEEPGKNKDNKYNNDKINFLNGRNNQNQLCPSAINDKEISPNTTPINENKKKNFTNYNGINNFISNKSLDKVVLQDLRSNQPVPTEMDFSHLLAIMANGKQNITNSNLNTIHDNINTNDDNNKNNNNSKDIKTQNNFKNNNEDKNPVNDNNNSDLNKSSNSRSFVINFFEEKQKTNIDPYGEGKTMIIIPQEDEVLLPSTLNNVFSENKEEKIKEEIFQSKKKENQRKILSFAKITAELFRNINYSIFLVDKNKDEIFEIKNNLSSFKLNKEIKDNEKLNNFISLCQDKLFLDKVSEISSDEELSIHHFDKKELVKQGIISFSLESIYQNINTHTNMKYSQNKDYQEKTLNYINKLINNKISSSSSSSDSSEKEKSSSFSNSFSSNSKSFSINSIIHKRQSCSLKNSEINSIKIDDILQLSNENSKENSNYKSEELYKIKKNRLNNIKHKKSTINNEIGIHNSIFAKGETELKNKIHVFKSMKPNQIINIDTIKNKSPKRKKKQNLRKSTKFTFKIDTLSNYDNNSSINDNNSNNNSKKKYDKKRTSAAIEDKKTKKLSTQKNSLFIIQDNYNIKTVKNPKTSRKSYLGFDIGRKSQVSEHRSSLKEKFTKRKSGQTYKLKSDHKLMALDEQKNNEGGIRNSLAYFAKEEKDGCKVQ